MMLNNADVAFAGTAADAHAEVVSLVVHPKVVNVAPLLIAAAAGVTVPIDTTARTDAMVATAIAPNRADRSHADERYRSTCLP